MDNSTNVLQEQADSQAADQISRTLMEKSSNCSIQDLLDGYEITDYYYQRHGDMD